MIINKFSTFRRLLCLVFFLQSTVACRPIDYWPPAYKTHRVAEQFGADEKWRLSSVLVPQNYANPLLQSSNGKVIFTGAFDPNSRGQIHVLDAQTGDEEITIPIVGPDFVISEDKIIIGTSDISGVGEVIALQIHDRTYEQLWTKGLPKSHALSYLAFSMGTIQANYTPDIFYMLDLNSSLDKLPFFAICTGSARRLTTIYT